MEFEVHVAFVFLQCPKELDVGITEPKFVIHKISNRAIVPVEG